MTKAKRNPSQRGRKSAASLAILRPVPTTPSRPISTLPEPPSHLTKDAKAWWKEVVRDYALEPHHLRLLQCAAEAWDRMQQARKALADHGALTFTDDKGTIKNHPAVSVEKDSRIAFARLVRELNLDQEPRHGD